MISTHQRLNHGLLGLLVCSLIVVLIYVSTNLTTYTAFHTRRESISAESASRNFYEGGMDHTNPQKGFDGIVDDPFHDSTYYNDKAFVTVVTDSNMIDAARVSVYSLQNISKTRANIMVIMAFNETFSSDASHDDYEQFATNNVQLLKVSPGYDPISEALSRFRKVVYFSNEILFKKNVDHYFSYPTHTILEDNNHNIGLRIYDNHSSKKEDASTPAPPPVFTSTSFPLSDEEIFWFNGPMKPWDFFQYHDMDWHKLYRPSAFYKWRSLYDDITVPSSSANGWSNQDRRKSICVSASENNGPLAAITTTDELIQDRFSVLLSTYKPERIQHLTLLIRHLLKSTLIDKIFITWHNPDLDVPPSLLENIDEAEERVRVLRQSFDSLNNRFNPVDQIQTEAVYILDDDVFLDINDLEFTFRVWQQPNNKNSIVGHFPRIHQYNSETHEAVYKVSNKDIYSMILTKSMFVRKEYLFAYTCLLDLGMHQDIDNWLNCEDIAFNLMVSGMTGAPMVAVTPQSPLLDFGTQNGISTNQAHMGGRGQCVSHFITKYWKEKDPLVVSSSAAIPYSRPEIRRGTWNKIEQQLRIYKDRSKITKL
ncbi:glycosyl transferase family 64 domain-containing protein [Phascolomyces articulosus]|uniref:Glycosyl transferase family 64 domain-containing protein n=1 Tax=Phascolomyces articulosus TaxID=60185 RepID=A0AAD5K9U2_9FUNG|nr:glycosyl transferase family 64 domain-containing protein [Phascolomyces articulosus]